MTSNPYDVLGVTPNDSPEAIKAAYHKQLKAFPAHTHPQEFKAIRAAYEAVGKGSKRNERRAFYEPLPLQVSVDPQLVVKVREQVQSKVELSLEDLIRLTF